MKKIEIIIWIAASIFAMYLSNRVFFLTESYSLVRNGIPIEGTVMEKRENQHQLIKYSYSVEGREYTEGSQNWDIGRKFTEIQMGEKVPVYYDATNPANSSLGDPKGIFYPNLRGAILISLSPTILFLGYRAKKKWLPR